MRCGLFGHRFAAPNRRKAHGVKVCAQSANSLSLAPSSDQGRRSLRFCPPTFLTACAKGHRDHIEEYNYHYPNWWKASLCKLQTWERQMGWDSG
jgi:hypothetical protein